MAIDERTEILDDYDTPKKRIAAWNEYRVKNPLFVPDLANADLNGANLNGADLTDAKLIDADLIDADLIDADLTRANLTRANLTDADLIGADLTDANLTDAKLIRANLTYATLNAANLTRATLNAATLNAAKLTRADLTDAKLIDADLIDADLTRAKLTRATLIDANLNITNLTDADLTDADLNGANLTGADLTDADVNGIVCYATIFVNTDLTGTRALETVKHQGPSEVSITTLDMCNGNLPQDFLRGCGFKPWQVLAARFHDITLSPADIAKIQQSVYDERTKGYFLKGIFMSYSRDDKDFVKRLHTRLENEGANVWLDTRHAIAGPLEKQAQRAIRINDVVLLVLSESSVNSDWVEAELEWARDKEKQTGLDILCPIALDDSWKSKVGSSVLWRKVKDKNILDFPKLENNEFNIAFKKLLDGLKKWYGRDALS